MKSLVVAQLVDLLDQDARDLDYVIEEIDENLSVFIFDLDYKLSTCADGCCVHSHLTSKAREELTAELAKRTDLMLLDLFAAIKISLAD